MNKCSDIPETSVHCLLVHVKRSRGGNVVAWEVSLMNDPGTRIVAKIRMAAGQRRKQACLEEKGTKEKYFRETLLTKSFHPHLDRRRIRFARCREYATLRPTHAEKRRESCLSMLCTSSDARPKPPYVLQRSGYSLVFGQF